MNFKRLDLVKMINRCLLLVLVIYIMVSFVLWVLKGDDWRYIIIYINYKIMILKKIEYKDLVVEKKMKWLFFFYYFRNIMGIIFILRKNIVVYLLLICIC